MCEKEDPGEPAEGVVGEERTKGDCQPYGGIRRPLRMRDEIAIPATFQIDIQ